MDFKHLAPVNVCYISKQKKKNNILFWKAAKDENIWELAD